MALLVLLLLLAVNQAAAMSLDRLALERNELPAAEPTAASTGDVVVDDMKMAAVPASGNTDMYMLVPESVASQLDAESEHVHRNTIDSSDADAAEPLQPESADMLMLESDDTPAMQMVELPQDITVAEAEPEAQTESQVDMESESQPETAVVASPELIEEHVVEHPVEEAEEQEEQEAPAPAPVAAASSQEAQLENAENVVETVTEAAQIESNANEEPVQQSEPQADDEAAALPIETEEEQVTSASVEKDAAEEAQSDVAQEQVQEQQQAQQQEQAQEQEQEPAQEQEQEQQSEPEDVQSKPVEEQSKFEAPEENSAAANEVDTTEASLMESMAEGIEDGLSAVMADLLPEESNVVPVEAEPEKQEDQPEEQQNEIEAQTALPEIEVETATEQLSAVESEPETVQADAVEQPSAEEPQPEQPAPVEIPTKSETQPEAAQSETEEDVQPETIEKETLNDAETLTNEVLPSEELAVIPAASAESETPKETEPEVADLPAEEQAVETQKLPEVLADETNDVVALQATPQAEVQAEVPAEPQAEVIAEPQAEVPSEPQATVQSEPQAEVEPQADIPAEVPAEPQAAAPAEHLAETQPEPQVEAQAEAQPEPQVEVQAEPLADDQSESQPEVLATPQVDSPVPPEPEKQSMLTTIIQVPHPSAEPVQVVDSVLNYVNASFMQPEPELQKTELEPESSFNSHLRRYDGAQVWRIVVQTDKDKKLADELQSKYDGQLWKEVKQEVDYLLKPQVLAAAERHIRAANLSRIVLIDNLQQVIEVENPPAEKIIELQNRKGHRLTWQAYHRLEDIHGFIDYMAKTYPDICSTEIIGYSVEKRPLKILKISNGNARNPGIWIDGGMHAREWISPATVTFIANQLAEGWDDLPEHMRSINWYIHPVANPDGYEYSHTTDRLWRKNMRAHGRQCPGVDLNRNFGYKWGGKGTSASPCSQTYRGSKAFSEPETFYISKFISGFPRETFQAYLSFHSYGQYILYPWGYDYHLTKDRADLDRVARQAGTIITKSSGVKYTVGSSATTLYPAAGGSDDWAKGIAGIKYSYTIEMGDTGRYGFVLPASFIQYNGKDGYTFADTVARAIIQGKSGRSSGSRRRIH
ncbi:hypothetical protein KR222_010606 [Zaprionus bogoriensis]|nr:hypothetical protein KR222_010606 [Zaprionus bogoriensis]